MKQYEMIEVMNTAQMLIPQQSKAANPSRISSPKARSSPENTILKSPQLSMEDKSMEVVHNKQMLTLPESKCDKGARTSNSSVPSSERNTISAEFQWRKEYRSIEFC
jgi:hypothetical protein